MFLQTALGLVECHGLPGVWVTAGNKEQHHYFVLLAFLRQPALLSRLLVALHDPGMCGGSTGTFPLCLFIMISMKRAT